MSSYQPQPVELRHAKVAEVAGALLLAFFLGARGAKAELVVRTESQPFSLDTRSLPSQVPPKAYFVVQGEGLLFTLDTRSLQPPKPPIGPFLIHAQSDWFTLNTRSLAPVTVAQSGLFTIDTTTGPLTVRGKVVDALGQPVTGALVSTATDGVRRSATTGPDGWYEIVSQTRGTLSIAAEKPGYRSNRRAVQLTASTATQDFQLHSEVRAPILDSPGSTDQPIARIAASGTGRLLAFDGTRFSTNGTVRLDLPSIVMTHGWLPCRDSTSDPSEVGANGWPREFAARIRQIGLSHE
ncbi:MAG: carboxypeptidase regulatory-like domain-containing protein [Verrucomicrobiales bacterium]|nr:carboxypeptidase regulatory-like domain-containing protein [Verrucomicrobiales bacterium]